MNCAVLGSFCSYYQHYLSQGLICIKTHSHFLGAGRGVFEGHLKLVLSLCIPFYYFSHYVMYIFIVELVS